MAKGGAATLREGLDPTDAEEEKNALGKDWVYKKAKSINVNRDLTFSSLQQVLLGNEKSPLSSHMLLLSP